MGKELRGRNLSDEELIDAIESVSPGIEVHHYHFWQTPPSIQELICSGGIHAGLVVGTDRVEPRTLSFRDEEFCVYQDDRLVTSAKAEAIMGGPLHSLRWLTGSLCELGESLPKGSLVIPGSPTELVKIDQDMELKVQIEGVGSVSADFRENASLGQRAASSNTA